MFDFFYGADISVARFAGALCSVGGGFFTPFFKIITSFGNSGIGFIVVSVFLLIFKRTRKVGFTALIAMLFGLIFTNLILKNAVARSRPYWDETSEFYDIWLAAGGHTESGYSFPSGHATASTAFATAIFMTCKKRVSWLAYLIPSVIGFTRIYFAVHFFSDVLFGFIVGFICGILSYFTIKLVCKIFIFNKILGA